jgi:transposase
VILAQGSRRLFAGVHGLLFFGVRFIRAATSQSARDCTGLDKRAGLPISQSTAYRLRQRMRQGGEQALHEGRHGHPIKLRGEVRKFLEETCRQAPHTPSHEIQMQLAERFSLSISVSQINRVRATLGVSNPPQSAKKK